MKKKFRLLIIDKNDDAWISGKPYLEDTYELIFATPHDAEDLDEIISSHVFDFVLISSDLAPLDYLDVLVYMKKTFDLPVLVVLNDRKETIDKIVSLEMGADDLINKPFEWRELTARLRAKIRLVQAIEARARYSPNLDHPRLAYFCGWTLDLDNQTLFSATSPAPELTGAEFKLLEVLISSPKRAVGRQKLLNLSHHDNLAANDRSIDILIARIRKKINDKPGSQSIIKTIRGVGYMFNADVEYCNSIPAMTHQHQLL